MSDDNPYVIPEMDPTLRKQIQECNWQIVNVTTPANYLHVLRRQINRDFLKPLVVMAPKNLLRHKDCKSNLSEFDEGLTSREPDLSALLKIKMTTLIWRRVSDGLFFALGRFTMSLMKSEERPVQRMLQYVE